MQLYNVTNVSAWAEGKDKELEKLKVGDKVTMDEANWQVIAIFKDENKVKFKKLP